MMARLTLLAAALLAVSNPAWSQPAANPAPAESDTSGRFFAFDVFFGAAMYDSGEKDEAGKAKNDAGWEVGGTVRVGPRWVGLTGSVGNGSIGDVAAYHLLVGPRFYIGEPGARWVAHALMGVARTHGGALSRTGTEFVLGGGMDLFILRFHFDYVRLNLAGSPKSSPRAFIGVVLPFCLRGCRDKDRLCGTGCSFGV
jgi:hypothetical protein